MKKGNKMAQFSGTIKGSRDNTISRLGHKTTGLTTTCNGWSIGVTCLASYNEATGKDEILVYKTGGSGGIERNKLIATIQEGI